MEYGLQMYSVRDITGTDLQGAIKRVADMGYAFLEFAGFFGHDAETVKRWMDDCGVRVFATHTGLRELDEDFERVLKYHKALGNTRIIIPGHDLRDQAKLDDFIARVNRYQPMLKAEGISLGYHNHSHEFIPNADGSMIHDQLVYRTNLDMEIDTFWYFNATGKSAVKLMERLKHRLMAVHMKDGFMRGEGKPLGMGAAPVSEVYEKAKQMGVPMVVESESLKPDGLTEARICIEYLKSLEA